MCIGAGGTLWSLQSQQRSRAPGIELYNVDRIAKSQNLDRLPKDDAGLAPKATPPVLGDPLPGDVGLAIVKSQQPVDQRMAPRSTDPAQLADEEAARRSSVFFRGAGSGGGGARQMAAPSSTPPAVNTDAGIAASSQSPFNAMATGTPPAATPSDRRQRRTARMRKGHS
jgi:type IV secretory pathway VirB10-like protein